MNGHLHSTRHPGTQEVMEKKSRAALFGAAQEMSPRGLYGLHLHSEVHDTEGPAATQIVFLGKCAPRLPQKELAH